MSIAAELPTAAAHADVSRGRQWHALVWSLIYLLLLEWSLPYLVPPQWVYHFRLDYEVAKQSPLNIDVALAQVKRQIEGDRQRRPVIILGDSVGFSGPGGPEQSIGYYMQEQAGDEPWAVYNLSMPAMQVGDIYAMVLKLKEYGIPLDNLIINLIYAGFVVRNPGPPAAFWLADELQRLDPAATAAVRGHLQANGRLQPVPPLQNWVYQTVIRHLSLVQYRDYLRARLLAGGKAETYDTRPWYEKAGLRAAISPYLGLFGPEPIVLDATNPQVYFLEKIIAGTRGSRVLFYLSPINQQLMATEVGRPGYQGNVRRIDEWFARQPVGYANLEPAIDQRLFSDHLHLTPAGYRLLAGMLWEHLQGQPPPAAVERERRPTGAVS